MANGEQETSSADNEDVEQSDEESHVEEVGGEEEMDASEAVDDDEDEIESDADNNLMHQFSKKEELKEAAAELEAKTRKSGIVYLSTIPPGMNVAKLHEIMSQYGKLGRIYLEPDKNAKSKRSKKMEEAKYGRRYLEGWVEFASKRIARNVAEVLNNQQVGGKRRSPYYESLWNIKYLHRFKWHHLTEQLAQEKIAHSHRLRQELSQAKRHTNFYKNNVEKSKMLEKMQKKKAKEGKDFAPLKTFEVPQKPTDDEIRQEKSRKVKRKTKHVAFSKHRGSTVDKSILQKLFPTK